MIVNGTSFEAMEYRALKSAGADLALVGRYLINDDYIFGHDQGSGPFEAPWSTNCFKAVVDVKTGGDDINKVTLSRIKCERFIFLELLDTTARLP